MTPVVKAVQRARPAVVSIRGEKTLDLEDKLPGELDAVQRVNGMGTGVVIEPRGYLITNFHVIDGVRQIEVTLADGRHCTARLIARDPRTDLAVIKIDVEDLPVIPIGTSSDLMPGETVIAVGNAYGYTHTVTRGIISAVHRPVQVSDAQFYDDLIQTDASINPGNSGGPLLNIDGQMIGLNVAVRAGAQGIGFAIPVDKALEVAARLLASHAGEQAWHGVVLGESSAAGAGGVVVGSVDPESPAAESGLKSGDVITTVDGLEMRQDLDFSRAMLERKPGERVRLAVRRSGEPVRVELTLAEARQPADTAGQAAWDLLGMKLEPIPAEEFRRKYKSRYRGGLRVTGVRRGGPAAGQGIRRGDVLVGMHIWETISMENVTYILDRPDFISLSPVKFFVLRGSETLYGYLPVAVKTAGVRR